MILLAIGLDPFSQQLLQLEQRVQYVESKWYSNPGAAFTLRATEFSDGKTQFAHSWSRKENSDRNPIINMTTQLGLPMQAAILNGLDLSRKSIIQQGNVRCPTGVCTFDQFESLSVCHRCNDLTSDLKRVDNFGKVYNALYHEDYENVFQKKNGTAFALPNGHFLMNINGCEVAVSGTCQYISPPIGHGAPEKLSLSSFGTGDPEKTNSMQDTNTLIWSMSMIHIDMEKITNSSKSVYEYGWPDIPLRAIECAIYYCVKSINLTVDGNVIHENVTEATDAVRDPSSFKFNPNLLDHVAPENIPPVNKLAPLEYNKLHTYVQRDDLILHFPDNTTKPEYSISDGAVWSLSHYIQDLFSTNITGGPNMTAVISDVLPKNAVGYNGVIGSSQTKPAAVGSIWNPDKRKLNIEDTFGTLAISMANRMRRDNVKLSVDYVYGHIGTPTQYYKTQWGWIVLHSMVLIGGAVFWCVTVRNSARPLEAVPAWKNSSLATMSRGSSAEEALKGADTVAEMEKKAREQRLMMPEKKASILHERSDENEDG